MSMNEEKITEPSGEAAMEKSEGLVQQQEHLTQVYNVWTGKLKSAPITAGNKPSLTRWSVSLCISSAYDGQLDLQHRSL